MNVTGHLITDVFYVGTAQEFECVLTRVHNFRNRVLNYKLLVLILEADRSITNEFYI